MTLVIPASPPLVPALDSSATDHGVADDVRAASRSLADAGVSLDADAAPPDWEGEAAEAAGHAATALADRVETYQGVLASITQAIDTFFSTMAGLEQQRTTLVELRSSLADRQADLAARGASCKGQHRAHPRPGGRRSRARRRSGRL